MFRDEFDGASFKKQSAYTIDKKISCSHDIEGLVLYGPPVIYICICRRVFVDGKTKKTRWITQERSKKMTAKKYCLIYGEFIECIEDEEQQERNVKQNDILIKK